MAGKKDDWERDELIRTGSRRKKASPGRTNKKRIPDDPAKRKKRRPAHVSIELDARQPAVNGYYIAIADRYRWARMLSVILLVAFLMIMLLFYRENITYGNLMYLIRDLDTGVVSAVGKYADISFERQYAPSFALFRDRIAVASAAGFRLYNASGSKELDYESAYADPRLAVGKKYALLYDADGKSYSIYTTIARVLSSQAEEVIEDAAVADDGTHALLTSSDESKYLITVYSPDFKPRVKYYKDKYVVDMALDSRGDQMAVVSAGAAGAGAYCEIMFCKVGSEETASVRLEGTMPLAVRYMDNGRLVVVCDNKVLFYDGEKQCGQYDITGAIPAAFDVNGDFFALAVSKNAIGSENEIILFDTDGNIIYNNIINEKIRTVAADGNRAIYVLCEDKAVQYPLSGEPPIEERLRGEGLDLLPARGGAVICESGGTYSLFFGE